MKRNMVQWLDSLLQDPYKKPMPILSFPAIQLMNITVNELISDSDLQAQAMKTIAERAKTAASVSQMDLSVEAECFGSEIRYFENEVPTVVGSIINETADAENLTVPEIGSGRTGIYIEAVKKAMELITDRPVLAGVIGPFSLAGRLMDVTTAMMNCFEKPNMVHIVLEKVSEFQIQYCKAYKAAGANGVVMAEPLAGLLSPTLADEFSNPYVKKIIDAVQDENFIVVYHNCGDSVIKMTDSLISTGASAYHFGNRIDMQEMLKLMPNDTIVMGNVDPAEQIKNGSPESVKNETQTILNKCFQYPNFLISSGCDIPAMAPWKNIDAFFQAVSEFYAKH
ncbi:MAG: uroporphyrinogen decarboxylase family protein [Bacillota bacterium]|jgi:uroporphyrinogen decarboxylase